MYMAVKHFKYFLEGRLFKIVTDQKSMNCAILALSTNLSQRQSKYILILLRSILLTSFMFQVQRMLLQIAGPGLNAMLCLKNFLQYLCTRWRLNNKPMQAFQT